MNSKTYVVMGEATESESEEEVNSPTVSTDEAESCKGKIIEGEAPESDEECCGAPAGSLESVSSAVSALSAPALRKKPKSSKKHESILVRKLYERNASLYKNITEFIQETATNASCELNATNRRLLKCQMQMQEGSDYLRSLKSNLANLDVQLQMLLSTKYLPVMKVDENTEKELAKPP